MNFEFVNGSVRIGFESEAELSLLRRTAAMRMISAASSAEQLTDATAILLGYTLRDLIDYSLPVAITSTDYLEVYAETLESVAQDAETDDLKLAQTMSAQFREAVALDPVELQVTEFHKMLEDTGPEDFLR